MVRLQRFGMGHFLLVLLAVDWVPPQSQHRSLGICSFAGRPWHPPKILRSNRRLISGRVHQLAESFSYLEWWP